MSKIKVLFLQATPHIGGDTIQHELLIRSLDRDVFDVHVVCDAGSPNRRPPTYHVLKAVPEVAFCPNYFGSLGNFRSWQGSLKTVFLDGPAMLRGVGQIIWYIKKHKIDIIHFLERPRDSGFGMVFTKATGVKSVMHVHCKVNDWFSPFTKFAMQRVDALIGVSNFVTKSIVANGYAADKTHCILNALDVSRWDPQTDGSAVRREFNIAPDTPLLVMIGRMNYWKGSSELLKALQHVKAGFPDFKVLMVGDEDLSAPPGEVRSLADLKNMARDLGLADQVTFTGYRRDIQQILAACDIYAMPAIDEAFGMVYLEAMAMQKPVVALESGGVPEFVEHGRVGLLSQPYDTEQFADHILALLTDPDRRSEMGRSARKMVEQSFTAQRMARDVAEVYYRLLGVPYASRALEYRI